jgi:putative methyltransferase
MARIYQDAAWAVEQVLQRGRGLRTVLYHHLKTASLKPVYALVTEVVRHDKLLSFLLEGAKLETKTPYLLHVLAYELLFGRGSISGGGKAKRELVASRSQLEARLQKWDGALPGNDARGIRYARLNPLRAPAEDWRAWGADEDDLVPGLLCFPPGTNLNDHPAVTGGKLVLQDKASCLPPVALAPEHHWIVVDACAAPGNKTSASVSA